MDRWEPSDRGLSKQAREVIAAENRFNTELAQSEAERVAAEPEAEEG